MILKTWEVYSVLAERTAADTVDHDLDAVGTAKMLLCAAGPHRQSRPEGGAEESAETSQHYIAAAQAKNPASL
jgi:hypothetical protein